MPVEVVGKYNTAIIYVDEIEDSVRYQVTNICNQEHLKDSDIRIMPDVHVGIGCVIGTTMKIKDVVIPNLVGVDIGCGMEVIKLKEKKNDLDLPLFDNMVRKLIPNGKSNRKTSHDLSYNINIDELICLDKLVEDKNELENIKEKIYCAIGTLGGGNHFIELNEDEENNIYLVIHSGSRNIGYQVARYYQKLAISKLTEKYNRDLNNIEKDLAYLIDEDMKNYLHDMNIMQKFAELNRKVMITELVNNMNLNIEDQFTTIHNYIDMENKILRKGSIAAYKDLKVLIPINMRDGSLICVGKGNPDWNYSAPHGAGRVYGRHMAMKNISLDEFRKSMEGIYTTSVSKKTIDEAPMAYKSADYILKYIDPTVEVINRLKPIYNFKAKE